MSDTPSDTDTRAWIKEAVVLASKTAATRLALALVGSLLALLGIFWAILEITVGPLSDNINTLDATTNERFLALENRLSENTTAATEVAVAVAGLQATLTKIDQIVTRLDAAAANGQVQNTEIMTRLAAVEAALSKQAPINYAPPKLPFENLFDHIALEDWFLEVTESKDQGGPRLIAYSAGTLDAVLRAQVIALTNAFDTIATDLVVSILRNQNNLADLNWVATRIALGDPGTDGRSIPSVDEIDAIETKLSRALWRDIDCRYYLELGRAALQPNDTDSQPDDASLTNWFRCRDKVVPILYEASAAQTQLRTRILLELNPLAIVTDVALINVDQRIQDETGKTKDLLAAILTANTEIRSELIE